MDIIRPSFLEIPATLFPLHGRISLRDLKEVVEVVRYPGLTLRPA